jgi:uncharacterized protein YqeY
MLWMAPIIGYGLYKVFSSDDSSSSRSSNRREVEEDYKEDKRDELQEDIKDYIDTQILYIKQKYNADIYINDTMSELSNTPELNGFFGHIGNLANINIEKDPKVKIQNKDKSLNNAIKNIKASVNEKQQVISLLEEAKNETII